MHNLHSSLKELAELLEKIGDVYWLSKVRAECACARPAEIVSWFGGMGSLNDLIISKINGHKFTEGQEDDLNQYLNDLRRSIYDLASQGLTGLDQ